MRFISITKSSDHSAEEVRQHLPDLVTKPLAGWGYKLQQKTDSGLLFVRRYYPWWSILIFAYVVITFPVSLVFSNANFALDSFVDIILNIIFFATSNLFLLLVAFLGRQTLTITFSLAAGPDNSSSMVINGSGPDEVVSALDRLEI